MHQTQSPTFLEAGDRPSAISKLMVRVVAELTGRGPTKVRTDIGPDVVTVVMRDTLTTAERSLIDDGHTDLVVSMRRAFQQTMSPTVIPAVERITGRRVLALLSDHHIDPDVAVETFVLAQPGDPDGDPSPAGAHR